MAQSAASPGLKIKFDTKEFEAWSRHMRTKEIKRVVMKVLKKAARNVVKAEKQEVRRAFGSSGRPAQAAYIGNAIQYEPFDRLHEVWVGPFRPTRPPKGGGAKKSSANSRKIIADHVQGSRFTSKTSGKRSFHASRLVTGAEVAIPVKSFKRGGTGKLAFGKVARGLTKEKAFNIGKDAAGKPIGNKGFRIQPFGGDDAQKSGPTFLAVRAKRPMADGWGWKQGPSSAKSRAIKGKKKGKRRIAVTHPYIIPLFLLSKRGAKVRPVIRFFPVARKRAPHAVARAFHIEFGRALKTSNKFRSDTAVYTATRTRNF